MTKQAIETGAAAPLVQGSGTTAPADWHDAGKPGTTAAQHRMNLGCSDKDIENGKYLIEGVRKAVAAVAKKGTVNASAVRELRRLVSELWSIVRSVPEFIDYMQWLSEKDLHAVHHILEAVPHVGERRASRGRPLGSYGYLVTMVDLVMSQEGGSAAKACERLYRMQPSPFRHFATIAAMQTAYSKHRDRVHAAEHVCILPEDLARVPYVLRR